MMIIKAITLLINKPLLKVCLVKPSPCSHFQKHQKYLAKALKYALEGKTLNMKKNKVGTRNKAIDSEIEIRFNKGHLLLFVEI